MPHPADADPLFRLLASLIDAWCDRRELKVLSDFLPGYLALNGLTDGWIHLYQALRAVRMYEGSLPPEEQDRLHEALIAVDQVLKANGVDANAITR